MKGFISPERSPFYKILILLCFVAAGACVGMFVAILGLKLFFGLSLTDAAQITVSPKDYTNGRSAMIWYQLATHLFMFTLGPLLFLKYAEEDVKQYLFRKKTQIGLVLLSAVLIIIMMPANSWLISWNAHLHLPDFLSGWEQKAQAMEKRLEELTKYLTQFNSLPEMLVGLLVFGFVPALGEELVFRGILQSNLSRWFNNKHLAIWLTAILFSAIHVQFFGFFPRLLLGALFGYLYVWCGNFWVPVAAHFANNGFTVILLYLNQQKLINLNADSTEPMPWHIALISLILSLGLLYFLYRSFRAVQEPEKYA